MGYRDLLSRPDPPSNVRVGAKIGGKGVRRILKTFGDLRSGLKTFGVQNGTLILE